jgi:YhcH/YjgK/YiaL family protein
MVVDQLQNASQYYALGPSLEKALRYLQNTDLAGMAPGRYELDGKALFVIVQEYEGKPREQGAWEAHRQYLDVQYVVSGSELFGYANTAHLQAGAYDPERDFLALQGDGDFFVLRQGSFVILAPQDAHMPSLAVAAPQPVKKAVVKVRIPGA